MMTNRAGYGIALVNDKFSCFTLKFCAKGSSGPFCHSAT